jgi:hypothetical protein
MDVDTADLRESSLPASSNGSNNAASGREKTTESKMGLATPRTSDAEEETESPSNVRGLGMLRFRPDDDDEPQWVHSASVHCALLTRPQGLVVRLDSNPTHRRYAGAYGQCFVNCRLGDPLEERVERIWSPRTREFEWKTRPRLVSWPRAGSCWTSTLTSAGSLLSMRLLWSVASSATSSFSSTLPDVSDTLWHCPLPLYYSTWRQDS